jgi:hypothetical protein
VTNGFKKDRLRLHHAGIELSDSVRLSLDELAREYQFSAGSPCISKATRRGKEAALDDIAKYLIANRRVGVRLV